LPAFPALLRRASRAPDRSLVRGDFVPVRTFEDSAGTVWEVFEVQRSSHKAQAVTAGLELGWLAFISSGQKRRLAPYPQHWTTVDDAELERLCSSARAARPTGFAIESGPAERATNDVAHRVRVPRIRPTRTPLASSDTSELPIAGSATSADSVEDTVREFAHQARARGLPAIEAMVRLKALLTRVYTEPRSAARDLHSVRRWFVEAYYFERAADSPPEAPDQSR
jgi:hypothetical protein